MKQNGTERNKMKQNKTKHKEMPKNVRDAKEAKNVRDAKEVKKKYQYLTKQNSPLTKFRKIKQNKIPKKTTQNKTKINEMKQKQRHTREVEGLVHHELLTKTNVAEVFLALADGDNLSTLVKHFFDDFFCCILRKSTNKNRLAPWRSLSHGGRRKICSIHKDVLVDSFH